MKIIFNHFPSLGKVLVTMAWIASALLSERIAAVQQLDDVPIVVAGAKPNLMVLLDNSASMKNGFLPDSLSLGPYNFNDNGLYGATNSSGKFYGGNTNWCSYKSFYSSAFNRQYYDPNVKYNPPYDSSGNRMADASFTAAPVDPFISGTTKLYISESDSYVSAPTGTVDLSTNFVPYMGGCISSNPWIVAIGTGSISGTTLTFNQPATNYRPIGLYTTNASGAGASKLSVGMTIIGQGIVQGTYITGFGTGTGDDGTYNIWPSQTVAQTAIIGVSTPDPAILNPNDTSTFKKGTVLVKGWIDESTTNTSTLHISSVLTPGAIIRPGQMIQTKNVTGRMFITGVVTTNTTYSIGIHSGTGGKPIAAYASSSSPDIIFLGSVGSSAAGANGGSPAIGSLAKATTTSNQYAVKGYIPTDLSTGRFTLAIPLNTSTNNSGNIANRAGMAPWGGCTGDTPPGIWTCGAIPTTLDLDLTAPALDPTKLAAGSTGSAARFSDAKSIPGKGFYCTYNDAATLPKGIFKMSSATSISDIPIPAVSDIATLTDNTKFTCKDVDETSTSPFHSRQNFANWFSYYRTRILTIKSVISIAMHGLVSSDGVTSTVRLGLLPLNQYPTYTSGTGTGATTYLINTMPSSTSGSHNYNFVEVKDYTATHQTTFLSTLNSVTPNSATPLPNGLQYVGEYYRTAKLGGKTYTDPITNSCQSNFVLIATDGAWNVNASYMPPDSSPSLSPGDTGTGANVPSLPAKSDDSSQTSIVDLVAGAPLTTDRPWPKPYASTLEASNLNSLANVAMYYWVTDLRTNNCTVGSNNICTNNVPTSPTSADPANWQHMSVFAIGLGIDGTLTYPDDFNAIKSNDKKWPIITGSGTSPASSAAAIDDLWHATVNGHGQYFSAGNAAQIQNSLTAALSTVIARAVIGNTVIFATPQISTPGNGVDNATFISNFNSKDWSGDLRAYPVLASDNATTGLKAGSIDTTSPLWPTDPTSAQAQYLLDKKVADDTTAAKETRIIVTHNGSSTSNPGIPFRSDSMVSTLGNANVTLKALLGDNVVEYFRGVRTLEDGATFRSRTHILGDIVDAEPAVLLPPYRSYYDPCYANPVSGVCSTAFKTAQSGRTRLVFQGANDGMLHVFNAAISTDTSHYGDRGKEIWAYIPNLVLNKMVGSATTSPANINYSHNYFVDGSPVIGDVDFNNTDNGNPHTTSGTPDWRTILVGGLGKGGRGYYALDITSPYPTDESEAKQYVLWEFPTSDSPYANMGFSFGRPAIVKTAGNGWVVLVPSGYNNGSSAGESGGDGHGHLFVLNAKTGELIADIQTADGSNLGHISAHVASNAADATVDYAYGVTLGGQVWRFNLLETVRDASGTSYADHLSPTASHTSLRPTWVATLKDPNGNTQAITTEPEVATISIDGTPKRFVFVATGKSLTKNDSSDSQTQTMYGFIDDLNVVSNASPILSNPRTATISGTTSNLLLPQILTGTSPRTIQGQTVGTNTFGKNVDYAKGQIGWYVDLPATGERVLARPILIPPGALIFNSNAPSSDTCLPGGTTWLNVLDYKNGGTLFGLNWASTQMSNSSVGGSALGVSVFQGQDGRIGLQVPGQPTTYLPQSASQPPSHRVSWREIPEQ